MSLPLLLSRLSRLLLFRVRWDRVCCHWQTEGREVTTLAGQLWQIHISKFYLFQIYGILIYCIFCSSYSDHSVKLEAFLDCNYIGTYPESMKVGGISLKTLSLSLLLAASNKVTDCLDTWEYFTHFLIFNHQKLSISCWCFYSVIHQYIPLMIYYQYSG